MQAKIKTDLKARFLYHETPSYFYTNASMEFLCESKKNAPSNLEWNEWHT